MSEAKNKLPANLTIAGAPEWSDRHVYFDKSGVLIGGHETLIPLAPVHVRAMLPRLAEWLAVVDPEGEPVPPEPAPPVARPDLPPVKVRLRACVLLPQLSALCQLAIEDLPVAAAPNWRAADDRRADAIEAVRRAVLDWTIHNIKFSEAFIDIEFDIQAGTATVVRPEKGGEA